MSGNYQDPDLSFLWMEVTNLSKSVEFYREALGLPVQDDAGPFAIVHLGNTRFYLAPGAPRGVGMHIAIAVPNLERLLERLRLHGVAAVAPIDEGWARYINLLDPDGYRLILLEPAAGSGSPS